MPRINCDLSIQVYLCTGPNNVKSLRIYYQQYAYKETNKKSATVHTPIHS